MATLKEVIEQDQTFQCDSCKKIFKARDVVFEDAIDNIKILTPLRPFLYLDKNNKIMGGSEQPSKEKGDKVLCCPHCKQVHLYGFDLSK